MIWRQQPDMSHGTASALTRSMRIIIVTTLALIGAACATNSDSEATLSHLMGAELGDRCRNDSHCAADQKCKRGVCQSRPGDGGADPGQGGSDGGAGTGGAGGGGAGSTTDPGPLAFPGARGFGTDSPCGRGGEVFIIDSQNDFDACILHDGPRVCVFETSGTFSAPIIRNPYLTIAGQTAPSPGIQISPQIHVRTHDVCVFHTRFRGNGSTGDVIYLRHEQEGAQEQTHDIVFDHVSVSWGTDENFSSYCGPGNAVDGQPGTPNGYVRDVTLSNSISSEGLVGHSMGFLAARPGHDNFSVIGNIFAHNNSRNPKLGSGQFVIANNLIYNPGARGIRLGSSGGVFDGYIVGNAVHSGPSTDSDVVPIGGNTGNVANNDLYLADLALDDVAPADAWSFMVWGGDNLTALGAPQSWVGDLDLQLIPSSEVRDRAVACAGARPLDRDPVDARIIADIVAGSGALISSAPPLPNLDGGSHMLPAVFSSGDWAADSDEDGYTDVEEELHRMAADLECAP